MWYHVNNYKNMRKTQIIFNSVQFTLVKILISFSSISLDPQCSNPVFLQNSTQYFQMIYREISQFNPPSFFKSNSIIAF